MKEHKQITLWAIVFMFWNLFILIGDTIPRYKINYEVWITNYGHSIGFSFIKKHFHYEMGAIIFPSQSKYENNYTGLNFGIKYFPEKFDKRWNGFLSCNVLSLYSENQSNYIFITKSQNWVNILWGGIGIQYKIFHTLFFNFQINTEISNWTYEKKKGYNGSAYKSYNFGIYYPFYDDNFNALIGLSYIF